MYYAIIISSFAFLWSHGHNCDRDRFLPKLVVYSDVLVVVQVRISCIQRRISCIQTCISCIQSIKNVPLIDGLKLFIRCRATKGVGAKLHRAFSTTIKKGFQ
jgi:hypothetical protein